MPHTTIDRLIVNSPYEDPARHRRYDRETRPFDLVEGRRPAGYVAATSGSRSFDDPGIFVEIPHRALGPARQAAAGQGAGAQPARARLGE